MVEGDTTAGERTACSGGLRNKCSPPAINRLCRRLRDPARRREPRRGPHPRRRARLSARLARKRALAVRCRRRSRTCRPIQPRCLPRVCPRVSRRTRRRRAAQPEGARPAPLLVTTSASRRGETSRGHRRADGGPTGPSCPAGSQPASRTRPRRRSRAGARLGPRSPVSRLPFRQTRCGLPECRGPRCVPGRRAAPRMSASAEPGGPKPNAVEQLGQVLDQRAAVSASRGGRRAAPR